MNRLLFLILVTAVFFSCKKESSNEFFPDLNNPYNDTAWVQTIPAAAPVNQIFQILATPSQTSSFNATSGGTLNFNDGVQIIFPANALLGVGTPTTVNVEMNYLKSKGDMIRFGKPTTSGEKFLISGDAFNIKVSQNGQPLQLAQGKEITIRYPNSQRDPSMNLFYGDTSANSMDGFNWVPETDTLTRKPVSTWEHEDSLSSFHTGYELLSKRFNWINCDHFSGFENLPRTKVSAILPVNFTNNNTAVFLVFADVFCLARMNADVDNHLFYTNDVPLNKNIIIVSLSKIGDDLYLGTKQITVTQNINVEMTPEKKTEQEISDYLNSL